MGQRSQIYVRYENQGRKDLIANYYQWNYGERMISRARWGIEFIKSVLKYKGLRDLKIGILYTRKTRKSFQEFLTQIST